MRKLYVSGICTLALTALLFCSVASAQGQTKSQVQSYREWKNTMVGAAESRVQKIKLSLEKQRQLAGSNLDPNLKNQLSKEQLQITIAGELTISDYFAGYLNKQNNLQMAINSVAGKLSSEEVAELMSAYAYNFNKIQIQPLKSASEGAPKPGLE